MSRPLIISWVTSRAEWRGWVLAHTGLTICLCALLLGGIALAVISVFVVAGMVDPIVLLSLSSGSTSGRVLAVIVLWCGMVLAASTVALVTGWFVCCGVPDRTGTRHLIRGSVLCVGIALAQVVLLQVLNLVAVPTGPEPDEALASAYNDPFDSRGRLRDPASFQKMREDRAKLIEAAQNRQDAQRTMSRTSQILLWLACLGAVTANASFGLFLGAVGQYLGKAALRLWSFGFGGLQAAIALWQTALIFVISVDSASALKLIATVTLGLNVATFAALIYMTYEARRAMPAD